MGRMMSPWITLEHIAHHRWREAAEMDVTHRARREGKRWIFVGLSTINYNLRESSLCCKWATFTLLPHCVSFYSALAPQHSAFLSSPNNVEIWANFYTSLASLPADRPTDECNESLKICCEAQGSEKLAGTELKVFLGSALFFVFHAERLKLGRSPSWMIKIWNFAPTRAFILRL